MSGSTDGGGTSLTPCTRERRGATYVRYPTHRHRPFNRGHALLVVNRRDRIHTYFPSTLQEQRIFLVMFTIPANTPRTSTGSVPTRESGPSLGLKPGDNVFESALSLPSCTCSTIGGPHGHLGNGQYRHIGRVTIQEAHGQCLIHAQTINSVSDLICASVGKVAAFARGHSAEPLIKPLKSHR